VVKFFSRADASSQALCWPNGKERIFALSGNGFVISRVIHKQSRNDRKPENRCGKLAGLRKLQRADAIRRRPIWSSAFRRPGPIAIPAA
jgi:hypothetical protein